eukprot:gb/GEZN01012884.1/.p1 GENE.gb/GEZN01012884.1/~~gb/GEZN01012884.1/.p1  ORF type:complete len:336 (-),score=49.21 gb/GEZN01012884.1/:43-1002(-)
MPISLFDQKRQRKITTAVNARKRRRLEEKRRWWLAATGQTASAAPRASPSSEGRENTCTLQVALNAMILYASPTESKKKIRRSKYAKYADFQLAAVYQAYVDLNANVDTQVAMSVFRERGNMRFGIKTIQQILMASYGLGGYVWEKIKEKARATKVMKGEIDGLGKRLVYLVEGNFSAMVVDLIKSAAHGAMLPTDPAEKVFGVIVVDFLLGHARVTVPAMADHTKPDLFSLAKLEGAVFPSLPMDAFTPSDFFIEREKKHRIYSFGIARNQREKTRTAVYLTLIKISKNQHVCEDIVTLVCSFLLKKPSKPSDQLVWL